MVVLFACNHSNDNHYVIAYLNIDSRGFPYQILATTDPCSTSFVDRDKLIETCDAFVD